MSEHDEPDYFTLMNLWDEERRMRRALNCPTVAQEDEEEEEPSAEVEEYPDNGPTDPWETSGPGVAKAEGKS